MNIGFNNKFDTNIFFSGGAGMFIQYHDIIKPVYLWAVLKMILNKENCNLPINILSHSRSMSLIEWYVNRRYQNPLISIDYLKKYQHSDLDKMLLDLLNEDESLYRLAPTLDVYKMLSVYRKQHMTFPIFIYSREYEQYIEKDIAGIFNGMPVKYLYGDLRSAVSNCNQNFTYMISDIELFKELADILIGSCSHLLLAHDYRYNFSDDHKTLKYNLYEMSKTHLYLKIESFSIANLNELVIETEKVLSSYKKEDTAKYATD